MVVILFSKKGQRHECGNIVYFKNRFCNMAAAEDEGKSGLNRFEALEQSIEQFIETTRQIGVIVSDFQTGSQGVLNQKM